MSDEDGDGDEEICSSGEQKKNKGLRRRIRLRSPFKRFRKLYRKISARVNPFKSCCLCFKPHVSPESPGRSQKNKPKINEFSYEYVKSLIESNDFYSEECNVHREN
ncbi:hypothetical protein AMTRI_Chr02g263120 [Amborella trichopoda]